ncbi:protein SOGA3 isoform X2 [Alligator mississippiensis]|uniref:protein SOGA3 isoform X2 n=1 Tax=Alligator mississippiensis TaxID=8496 RepID=UPI0003D09889|nr:protein SOGA3 isoform X2 [Alligator mississippiensis]XP_059568872.1 protein SOGA3 isoform X2 [Alligator mississippiensis]
MDLRKQLENTERNWNKEKMELLERFDNERKEWECQWKVMQMKIEELYQEVKLRRENNMNAHDNKAIHSKMLQLSVYSPASEQNDTAELNHEHKANDRMEGESSLSKTGEEWKDTRTKKKNSALVRDNLTFEDPEESEVCLSLKTPKDAKISTSDLNVALKELAKVSEELCSYQEEIRKKSNHRRIKSLSFLGESEEMQNTVSMPERNHVFSNEPQMASLPFETEEQNNRKNLMSSNRSVSSSSTLTGSGGIDFMPCQRKEAPPVPPRSTSRHLTNSLSAIVQVSEVPTKDSGKRSNGRLQECRSEKNIIKTCAKQNDTPGACVDEGKSVKGPTLVTASVDVANKERVSDCNRLISFCHKTWGCDVGKFGKSTKNGSSPLSAQKSCSDSNMVPSEKTHQRYYPTPQHGLQHSSDFYAPTTLHDDHIGNSGYSLDKTQRNETLAAKIDEFNRTVFHTDKCNISFQENTKLQALSSENQKPGSPQCDSVVNRTETVNPACDSNPRLTTAKEKEYFNPNKTVKTTGREKQINGLPSSSGYRHMFHEHDWRPSNLSGRPRSADSRSNYGVVEKLLKNYEKSTVTSLCETKGCKDKWTQSESECTERGLNQYLETLQTEQGKQELQKNSSRHIRQQIKQGKERQKLPEISVPAKYSSGKGFSRPARPANRRLPSRWASRSPSAPPAVRRTAYNYSVSLRLENSVV